MLAPLTPQTFLLALALLFTVASFIPRLSVPWAVPVLLVIVALLVR